MAKVTPEAADAIHDAFKSRTVKQFDISQEHTIINRVTYDDKGRMISKKLLRSVKHV